MKLIDENLLLHEALNNSPCGYVLMDRKWKVLFASDYYLEYMGISAQQIIGNYCYEVIATCSSPCLNCSVQQAFNSRENSSMRKEVITKNGKKIYDLISVPLKNNDGTIDYVIEMLIDRTEEVLSQRQCELEYDKLIQTLSQLLADYNDNTSDQKLTNQIKHLTARLNELVRSIRD